MTLSKNLKSLLYFVMEDKSTRSARHGSSMPEVNVVGLLKCFVQVCVKDTRLVTYLFSRQFPLAMFV